MYGECANHYMCNSPCTGLSLCLLVLVEHVITSFITPPSLIPGKACVCIPDFNCAVKPLSLNFKEYYRLMSSLAPVRKKCVQAFSEVIHQHDFLVSQIDSFHYLETSSSFNCLFCSMEVKYSLTC